MGRLEKRINKWLNSPPFDAPAEEVQAVLKSHFPGRFRRKPGSNIVVRDERLRFSHGFEPFGEFTIPVSGGQRVKGRYLQRLARAIRIIEELET